MFRASSCPSPGAQKCSSSLWFYHWSVVVTVLLVVVGPAGRLAGRLADHDQQHCYHDAPTVKPEATTAVVELLMMGVRTPETCWAVHKSKRQVMNLRSCCIWLVDLFEKYMPTYLHSAFSASVTSLSYRQIAMHLSSTQLTAASCM
jgi:hypothetical protein